MNKNYKYFLKDSIKDYRFWIKLLLGTAQLLTILAFIIDTYIRTMKLWGTDGYHLTPAFNTIFINLSFFTTLSNLLCGIFFVYSAFNHPFEGQDKFDNDNVAKTVVVYITLTLLLYNIDQILGPDPYIYKRIIEHFSFIFEHSLGPIVAILYYIFLYNHQNTCTIKDFSKKYLWYMVIGLISYGIFFIILGVLAKYGGGLGFYYWNGATEYGKGSYFPYPFLDFKHTPYFFKKISGASESTIMLLATIALAIAVEYFYSFLAITVKNKKWQEKLFLTTAN